MRLFEDAWWKIESKEVPGKMLWWHNVTNEVQEEFVVTIDAAMVCGEGLFDEQEFAVTNVADAAIFTEFLRLLSERYVSIVCTSNRAPGDLYSEGLHRERHMPALVEHLNSHFLVVPVTGPDYREALLQSEADDLTASADAAKAADADADAPDAGEMLSGDKVPPVIFEGDDVESALRVALSADAGGVPELAPGSVKVAWGRQLKVPLAGAGTACFHFDDLCRRAYGAEDFLCLATGFHTIVVHGIPRLGLQEHNEARRFTNLVDAVYEHSVRFVCLSDGPLEEVLSSVEALQETSGDAEGMDADKLGFFEKMYDDTPNFQLQIQELGGREKYTELRDKREASEIRETVRRLTRHAAPDAAEGGTGSNWSTAPASADLSAPQDGVAGVMVAAVGSLQESGFAAKRAVSRLREMRTAPYLEAAKLRREVMMAGC
eukprot:gnl/TRDRNA2_/TRDRNA2_176228_c1_seq11.p1 gnl/TRDRNA2_/TRDRNA2_176228_c1~~gnl/TRDRNA2_/TRDRNA2_176228_c1_seq11.p1  ORF type:complete len:433 (+),score=92.16 gnl/TRDRNA2_/TRDRNA2_176228_c1_seq11:460-1758(+)